MIVAIQQPEHLPWLGFFDKMSRCDIFVLLDNVQFKKRYFENRNKIRTKDGWHWVTVPVISKGRYTQLINQVEVDNTSHWMKKCWDSISLNYKKAPYFDRYKAFFEGIYVREWAMLVDLNVEIIKIIASILGIKTELIFASDLTTGENRGSDLIFEICNKLKATTYISGPDGENYLEINKFTKGGVEVKFHDYKHPAYKQLYEPFISHMSIIDLLFNYGDESSSILAKPQEALTFEPMSNVA